MSAQTLEHMLSAARSSAAGHHNVLSTGESLAAALIRNRPDLLGSYTIVEALDRIGEGWAAALPAAGRAWRIERDQAQERAEQQAIETQLAALDEAAPAGAGVIDANAMLVTYGNAPGYRDCSLTVDVVPLGKAQAHRLSLRFNTADTLDIFDHLRQVNRSAWSSGRGAPLDLRDGEARPGWLDA